MGLSSVNVPGMDELKRQGRQTFWLTLAILVVSLAALGVGIAALIR